MTDQSKITVDGEEYDRTKFTQKQNYLLRQLDDLQSKASSLQFQLDQVDVARHAFLNALKAELAQDAAEQPAE